VVLQIPGHHSLKLFNGMPVRDILTSPSLPAVTLTNLKLGPPEAAIISRMVNDMASVATLTSLDVSKNNFNYRAVDVLLRSVVIKMIMLIIIITTTTITIIIAIIPPSPPFSFSHLAHRSLVPRSGLMELPGLKHLNVANNPLAVEGAEALAYFLYQNKTLTHLDATSCDLCSNGYAQRGLEGMRFALTRNTTLVRLDLAQNDAMEHIVSRIQDSLRVNRSLTYESGSGGGRNNRRDSEQDL
jgi:hypothetical protein